MRWGDQKPERPADPFAAAFERDFRDRRATKTRKPLSPVKFVLLTVGSVVGIPVVGGAAGVLGGAWLQGVRDPVPSASADRASGTELPGLRVTGSLERPRQTPLRYEAGYFITCTETTVSFAELTLHATIRSAEQLPGAVLKAQTVELPTEDFTCSQATGDVAQTDVNDAIQVMAIQEFLQG